MSNQDKHHWILTPVPDTLKGTFDTRWECTRGDCKCEKLHSQKKQGGKIYHVYLYSRGMAIAMQYCPPCHGDIPLNQQTID